MYCITISILNRHHHQLVYDHENASWMVRPVTCSAHADRWFGPIVLALADGWFGPLHFRSTSVLKSATVVLAQASSRILSNGILRIVVLTHAICGVIRLKMENMIAHRYIHTHSHANIIIKLYNIFLYSNIHKIALDIIKYWYKFM